MIVPQYRTEGITSHRKDRRQIAAIDSSFSNLECFPTNDQVSAPPHDSAALKATDFEARRAAKKLAGGVSHRIPVPDQISPGRGGTIPGQESPYETLGRETSCPPPTCRCTITSFSAPRIAHASSALNGVCDFTGISEASFKIWTAFRNPSAALRTTFISSSVFGRLIASRTSSATSRPIHRDGYGSITMGRLLGRRVMGRSPSAPGLSRKCGSILKRRRPITRCVAFRRNTLRFLNAGWWITTSGFFGDPVPPLPGLHLDLAIIRWLTPPANFLTALRALTVGRR
jgi:hypothetical protein